MSDADRERAEMLELLSEAKHLGQRYYALTKRPLGVTGEVAELEAVRHLGLQIAPMRTAGFDAVRRNDGLETKIQIKGRCVQGQRYKPSQRLGRIRLDQPWDFVILVLLDLKLDAIEMHEASRAAVSDALTAPGSKARNVRGALSVGKFKAIGKLVWPPPM